MKVLLSCGLKTQNILTGIDRKFQSSADEFLVVEYMDNIKELLAHGEYYDKAIISEQSITKEFSISDETEIRERINKFATECAARNDGCTYVFLTQMSDFATIIYEEILPILGNSVVVLKQPPYSISFFVSLIVDDVHQLPSEITFIPQDIASDELEGIEFVEETESENYDNTGIEFENENVNTDGIFGLANNTETEDDAETETELSDDLFEGIEGLEEPDDKLDNIEFTDETDDTEWGEAEDNNEISNDSFEVTNDDEWGEAEDETSIDDLFESIDDTNSETESIDDNKTDELNTANNFLEGFDEPYNNEVDASNSNIGILDNDMYEDKDNTEAAALFEDDMYTNDTNEQSGFNDDMYDTINEIPIDTEESDIKDDDYTDINNDDVVVAPTISNDDYTEEEDNSDNTLNSMEQTVVTNQQAPKKKSLFGRKQKQSNTESNIQKTQIKEQGNKSSVNVNAVRNALKPFAARGNSILVTGCGGCGTSTIAYSLANIVSQLGYTVLLVDMDCEGRTQNYISKANYDSMDPDGANLMAAVNSSNGANSQISIVKQGFHLLTMGLGADVAPLSEILQKDKLSRFHNLAKSSHNFIIYDVPFKDATCFLSDITYMCDNLVLVTDTSNWGITKTMLSVCNIATDEMQETFFSRAQIVFNKYRGLNKVFGKKVRTCADIEKEMDKKVFELVGEDPGLYFEQLHIAGIINDDPVIESGWYENVNYSDTKKGQEIFLKLIESIVLTK